MKNRHPAWISPLLVLLTSGSLVFGCVPLDDSIEPSSALQADEEEELFLDGPTYDGLGCHAECEVECGGSQGCYEACFEACEVECQVDCGAECWDDDSCYLGCFDVCVHPENAEFSPA